MGVAEEERLALKREKARAYYLATAEIRKAQSRAWYQANREQAAFAKRDWTLRKKYGLTSSDVDALLISQGGCALCGETTKKPHVDHDHSTGKVRQILCPRCNRGLHFLENKEWLPKATAYLEKHGGD